MDSEVFKGMHEAAASSMMKRLGQSLARAGGKEEGEVTRHPFQGIL